MRWDMDGIPSRAELERENMELKQQVAELKKQSGEPQDRPLQKRSNVAFDFEQFRQKREEEELENRWYWKQEKMKRAELFKLEPKSLLEQIELCRSSKDEKPLKTSRRSEGITIDWRGIPLIVVAMSLVWIWFSRPAEWNFGNQRSSVQLTQTVR